MNPHNIKCNLVVWILVLYIFIHFVGCVNTSSPDEIAKVKIFKGTKLLISLDKVAARPTEIRRMKEGIATLSTEEVDNFVKKKISLWVNTANELEHFLLNYPSSKFSKDAIFTASLLWIAISQADKQYCKNSITVCKRALTLDYDSRLNDESIKMLSKAPSVKYLIENEFHKKDGIKSFLRGMLVTEYIKMDNVSDAEKWLETSDISTEEKQRLTEYINSYKRLK